MKRTADPLAATRDLLAAALLAKDPRPLLEGARALLDALAAPEGPSRARLARDLLGAAAALADPAPVIRAALALLETEEERGAGPARPIDARRVAGA